MVGEVLRLLEGRERLRKRELEEDREEIREVMDSGPPSREPPGADPHAWWCGDRGLEAPGYPIGHQRSQKPKTFTPGTAGRARAASNALARHRPPR